MLAAGNHTFEKEILNLLESAQVLVLDFDGTLVASNDIKRKAFEKCFEDYPRHFNSIMEYCRGYNHVPRQEKFRHVFENILKLPYTPEIEKAFLDQYAAETTEQVVAAPEIPGALSFLESFFVKKELVLLSSTPHNFLDLILERRGMKKYFKKIQGAPVQKALWLAQLLEDGKWSQTDVVFIGDSAEDLRSAQKVGIPFMGIGSSLVGQTKYCIDNFTKIF